MVWLGLDLGLVLLLPKKLKFLDLALLVKRWLSYVHLVNFCGSRPGAPNFWKDFLLLQPPKIYSM